MLKSFLVDDTALTRSLSLARLKPWTAGMTWRRSPANPSGLFHRHPSRDWFCPRTSIVRCLDGPGVSRVSARHSRRKRNATSERVN